MTPPVSARMPVATDVRRRALAAWLVAVAALIFIMVLVGGATRLTRSGLSIVEWRPVTGVVPPLSDADWQTEFAKYRTIPQYRELNQGMTLAEFKGIFWWEWAHRLLGRVIGFVFLLPLIVFVWKGWVEPPLQRRLWLIFGLGAFQGAVGWWMVASGLAERVSVSQYRLAFHLTLACAIYAAILWTAAQFTGSVKGAGAPPRVRRSALGLMLLVFLQIYLGALVAGLHAGLIYNTWPLIDGRFIPALDKLFFMSPWWSNLFESTLTVQFLHRMVAYALWAAALLHAADTLRSRLPPALRTRAVVLAGAVTLQACLGIITLLHQAPIELALPHQTMALIVLTIAVVHASRCRPPLGANMEEEAGQAPPVGLTPRPAPAQGRR
jgi:cytochrome c oxidase assembly protein subunit 15